jgi:hypothetical protein
VASVVAAAAVSDVPQSGEVTDPAGDVKNGAEPWQDVVRGRIDRAGGTFTFSMTVASALPGDPAAASGGLGWYMWLWGVDSDPDLSAAGWPFPNTQSAPHDFIVAFASDGGDYFAFVADRRPLAVGQEPIITPVPASFDGASVRVVVDADLLDDPADFLWRCGTTTSHAHFESNGFQLVDLNDANWVAWPQN